MYIKGDEVRTPLALVMGHVPRGWWEKALCCKQTEKGNG